MSEITRMRRPFQSPGPLYTVAVPFFAGHIRVEATAASVRTVTLIRAARPSSAGRREGSPPSWLLRLVKDLTRYGTGRPATFRAPLDLSLGTAFQQAVWRAAQDIPPGEVRTYGWVAGHIGRPKASRAVGQALKANPIPILVPCHRVVSGSGIGGFSGGLDWKRRLLRLEGGTI